MVHKVILPLFTLSPKYKHWNITGKKNAYKFMLIKYFNKKCALHCHVPP